MDIINVVCLCIVGLEHRKNFTAVMDQLNRPYNTIFHVDANQALEKYNLIPELVILLLRPPLMGGQTRKLLGEK